jgi:hypothetical protein
MITINLDFDFEFDYNLYLGFCNICGIGCVIYNSKNLIGATFKNPFFGIPSFLIQCTLNYGYGYFCGFISPIVILAMILFHPLLF